MAAWKQLEYISRSAPSISNMKRSFLLQAPAYFHDPAKAEMIDLDMIRWGPNSLWAWLHMSQFDLRPRLPEIRTPTLVIAGRHDRAIPVTFSEEIVQWIPGAALAVSETSGHFPFIEDADWFDGTLKRFVDI